jgi:hypothetical protein
MLVCLDNGTSAVSQEGADVKDDSIPALGIDAYIACERTSDLS